MEQTSQERAKKGDPSARSLRELMDLLLKLNSKIREKISPRAPKEDKPRTNMEMVIIILNRSSEKAPKTSRPQKTKTAGGEWIEDLCEEIQKGGRKPA